MEKLEKKCDWHGNAIIQFERERKHFGRIKAYKGTQGFRNMGCFTCDGYNTECKGYTNNDK